METERIMENPKSIELLKKHRNFVHGLIVKIASAANVELTEATQAIYVERLIQLTTEQVTEATRRTIEEWSESSKMPPLAFILARCGSDPKLLAEQAWELVLKLIKRDWYADGIGWVGGAEKKLTVAMQYAIRQCGGEYRMAYANDEVFPFIRRDFLKAYERFSLEGGEQIRLTQGEARQFLSHIQAELPKWSEAIPEIPEGSIAEITPAWKPRQLTAEEHEARIAELRRQAKDLGVDFK